MRLTLRTTFDNYIDVDLDIYNRTITFISPIPGIDTEDLMNMADKFKFKMILPISGEQIVPELQTITIEEIKQNYTLDTEAVLTLLLSLANCTISGD